MIVTVFASSSIIAEPHPHTQHLPIPRATTAACEVIPPRIVKIASDATIPTISSGEVSARTKTTFSPLACLASASSAVNASLPVPAPGPAAKPVAIGVAFFNSFLSNSGNNNLSKD